MGDTLYVADWGNQRVVALTKDLAFKFSFRKGTDAMEPCGIAASDTELFVSDQTAHQLHVFSPAGEFLRSIGANGSEPGQFKSPCGVTYVGGVLFVAEYVGRRVQALGTDGTPLQVCSTSFAPRLAHLRCAVATPPRQVLPVADATSLYGLCVLRPQPRTASCTLYITGAPLAPLNGQAAFYLPHPSSVSVRERPCYRLRDRGAARAEPRVGAVADCVRGDLPHHNRHCKTTALLRYES